MRTSAGLLAFRRRGDELEVFLIHPGGPFWLNKDDGAWMLPKGEYIQGEEEPLAAARREFVEETGFPAEGEFIPLGSTKQKGGKRVTAWAFESDFDASLLESNLFRMQWPPKSGKMEAFPEVDRGEWYGMARARVKILASQEVFLDRLLEIVVQLREPHTTQERILTDLTDTNG
jgi:predicted NUDIX family NTP pyrophosphohydrolase